MQIRVQGTNVDIDAGVRDEAVHKLSKVRQIFDQFLDMEVTFTQETNPRISDKTRCEVVLRAKGNTLRASAAAPDALTAIDRVEDKLTRQVRKLKSKLISRSRQATPPPLDGRLTDTDRVDVPSSESSSPPAEE